MTSKKTFNKKENFKNLKSSDSAVVQSAGVSMLEIDNVNSVIF